MDNMSFGKAIAICANLNRPKEREKFTEDEIMEAIRIVLDHEGNDVLKAALHNMCEYLLGKVDDVPIPQ